VLHDDGVFAPKHVGAF